MDMSLLFVRIAVVTVRRFSDSFSFSLLSSSPVLVPLIVFASCTVRSIASFLFSFTIVPDFCSIDSICTRRAKMPITNALFTTAETPETRFY